VGEPIFSRPVGDDALLSALLETEAVARRLAVGRAASTHRVGVAGRRQTMSHNLITWVESGVGITLPPAATSPIASASSTASTSAAALACSAPSELQQRAALVVVVVVVGVAALLRVGVRSLTERVVSDLFVE
jgi:hypothetical protein